MNYTEPSTLAEVPSPASKPTKRLFIGLSLFLILVLGYFIIFFYGASLTLSKQETIRLPYNWKPLAEKSDAVSSKEGVSFQISAIPFDVVYDSSRFSDLEARDYVRSQLTASKIDSEKPGMIFIQTQNFPNTALLKSIYSNTALSTKKVFISAVNQRKNIIALEEGNYFLFSSYDVKSGTVSTAKVNYSGLIEKQILVGDFQHLSSL